MRMSGEQWAVAWVAVVCWMGVIFVLSAIPSLTSPLEPLYDTILRKLAHVGEYALLVWLLARALRLSSVTPQHTLGMAVLFSLLYAATDEWHQSFVPGRVGSLRDIAIDAVGIIGMYTWGRTRNTAPS